MLRTAPRTRHFVIYTVLLCLAILTPLTAIQAAQTGQPRIVNVSLLTSAQVSTTPAQNVLDSNRMGIEPYAAVSANMWLVSVHHAQTLGFGWLKLSVAWKDIEPTKGTFSAQLALLKQNILYAKSQSFKILLSVAKAPDWARDCPNACQYDGPPKSPQRLADFVSKLLSQLGTDSVNAIEIWSAANTSSEWTGEPLTADTYQRFFNAAYMTIRAQSTDIVIITAAPAPTKSSQASIDDRQWLKQLYESGLPMQDTNFAIGVHPFGWANSPDAQCCSNRGWDDQPQFFFLDTLLDYHKIMLDHGHLHGQLWVTQFGWPSFDGLHVFKQGAALPAATPQTPQSFWLTKLTAQQQADYTLGAYRLVQSTSLNDFVGPMFLYNLDFAIQPGFVPPIISAQPDAAFSLLDSNGAPRAIYNAIVIAPKHN